ncbi:DUF3152 domain-containing protein [Streptomyces violens]|uniref:DUF3152 domain-containing protein n=1 Tax=Streptomyces violens TaxID=66377 RepID=UPI0009966D30|nr:DUF3152 domain-containing protein [Streptomyces violens]
MGRHSRRTPEGTTDTTESGAVTGVTGTAAQWGERAAASRRPVDAADAPSPDQGAVAGPQAASASRTGRRRRRGEPGPEAGPPVRGGHPEQPEPGAVPGQGVPVLPHQRGTGGARPGVLGTPVDPGGGRPGPKQEYLDAFANDAHFAAGTPSSAGSRPPKAARPPVAASSSPVSDAPQGLSPSAAPHPYAAGADEEIAAYEAEFGAQGALDDDASGDARRRKGAKGRTFTGVAAAAVTTVLAVVVAGQVADARKNGVDGPSPSGGDATPDPDAGRPHGGPTAAPATYAAKMAKVYPLAADLKGSGTFTPAGGAAPAPGRGHVVRYRVDVEDGLPLDGELFAEAVHKTLNDERSWAHGGQRSFARVASGKADFVITLASPGTTDEWCAKSGLDTSVDRVSCDSAATERVMINAYRWARGAATYGPDKMYAYRQMLINHEVGHRLGHDHEGCRRQGALAPVMMQQTKFLTTDGATCRPNAWPFPTG